MTDQTLPTFDSDPSIQEAPAPRKSRPRPQRKRPAKKVAKRTKRERIMTVVAKRVPKKRRTRKPIQYGTAVQKAAAGRAYAAEQKEPPLMTKEFNTTLDIIGMLHDFEPLIRRRIMDRLIKTFP